MIKIEYIPKPKHFRAKCKCGCIFTYDEQDTVQKRFGHGESWEVVFCPNCGNNIGTPWDESEVSER